MALYSIRQNTDSARVIASAPGLGSIFSVVSSFSRLSEKRDQSSAPSVTVNEDGKPVLRGPHNIMRTVLEFAIDERDGVAVYLGSPAEIVSTLYWLGNSAVSNTAEGVFLRNWGAALYSAFWSLSRRFRSCAACQ